MIGERSLHAVPGVGVLFATDGRGGGLYRVDPATGVGTLIGVTGVFAMPSLAVDPATGVLYGGSGAGVPQLYRLDPLTAAATFVGSTGLVFASIGGMDFSADGILFAAVNIVGGGGTGSDHLATIDRFTGAARVIGPFGTCVAGACTIEGMEAIAFDADGRLWGAVSARGAAGDPGLYRIDPTTGAATFFVPILDAFGQPPSGGVVSLQFACDATLYGGTARAIPPADDGGRLVRIDPTTGTFAFVGPVPAVERSLAALAFNRACGDRVTNRVSRFLVIVDGQFTDGIATTPTTDSGGNVVFERQIQGEWSDVTPLAFVSPLQPGGSLFRTDPRDPRANSLLYAALAPGVADIGIEDLYLMYDYPPRRECRFAPGEFIADIAFPIVVAGGPRDIVVQVRGAAAGTPVNGCAALSFFDVGVDLDLDGTADAPAGDFGIGAAVGFGPSTLTDDPHLLVELEVSLHIPPGFGDLDGDGEQDPGEPFPPAGHVGTYSPDPALWTGSFANDLVDPPGSSALFTIARDGATSAASTALPHAPANLRPELLCPGPATRPCEAGGLPVPLTAHVQDPDGDALTVTWLVDGLVAQVDFVPGGGPPTAADVTLATTFAVGTHTVMVSVSDGTHEPIVCETTVTIEDDTPPIVTPPTVERTLIWPPNDKFFDVVVHYEATDLCDPTLSCFLEVSSSESIGRGQGKGKDKKGKKAKKPKKEKKEKKKDKTGGKHDDGADEDADWIVVDAHHVRLRAKRAGPGTGRLYTIVVTCTDTAGNEASRSLTVLVPHDLR